MVHPEQQVEGIALDDDDDRSIEQEETECPDIRLSRTIKTRLRRRWCQTLIIKIMGRTVGFHYLLGRLIATWLQKAPMDLVAIENDYFQVKFASVNDYHYAKYEGPWLVLDHCLIVKDWHHDFDPFSATTERMLAWVQLPGLPIEYYDKEVIWMVGEKIGRPNRVDDTTSLVTRGKFAHLCVEVDITKPLL